MSWFRQRISPLVVEVPAPTHIPGVEAVEALVALKDQLGFRYLLHQLRNASAFVETQLLANKHADLAAVARLQGERAGLRFVENYIRRMTETKPEREARPAARSELQIFEQVRSQLDDVR